MVTHYLTNKTKTFDGFDRFSSFVLIGNNIDGFVNVDLIKFNNYEEAMKALPGIFNNLEFGGEWDLSFYQVPENFSIKTQYGYYKSPMEGSKVFEFSYMNSGEDNQIFLTPALIHISYTFKDIEEQWEDGEDHLNFDIYEGYFTIQLKEYLDRKSFKDEDYRGDITALYVEAYK